MTKNVIVPEPLYIGGFLNSGEVLEAAIDEFWMEKPVRVYYPGSSQDASFVGIEGVEVLHVDTDLTRRDIEAFKSVGSLAVCADAHDFVPEGEFDVVLFINASGIRELDVIDIINLRRGGLILSAMWAMQPPTELVESEDLELAAVGVYEDGVTIISREGLEDYTTRMQFEDLDDTMQKEFCKQALDFLGRWGQSEGLSPEIIAQSMLSKSGELFEQFADVLQYRKTASFFIFRYLR
jgi:hypothetical protein